MAITTPSFVSAGGGTGGTTSITPALPGTYSVDDIFILVCESGGTEALNTPSGWGLVDSAQETGDAATGTRLTVFWRRATASESAPSVTGTTDHVVGRIAAYTGCTSIGDPWNTVTGGVDSSASTSVAITGVTTTINNCLILNIICTPFDTNVSNQVSGWANGNLSSITERFDNFTTTANGGGIGMVDGVKAGAGPTGDTAVTLTNSAVAAFMTLALQGANTSPNPMGRMVGS